MAAELHSRFTGRLLLRERVEAYVLERTVGQLFIQVVLAEVVLAQGVLAQGVLA